MQIEFQYVTGQYDIGDEFYIQYFDGSVWQIIESYVFESGMSNGTVYNGSVIIDENAFTFPSNMKIRFKADSAHVLNEAVYIDAIRISVR